MKAIAMYLPQFHRTPENDKWWGEGFTEWTAVKTATSLFDEHIQPRLPLNDNYYNLLERETMIWQAQLAKQYNLEGFCFYHYYFKDGRKILEKPAENLYKWKDINMKFCFCWANETWARTWNRFGGTNSWADKFENVKQSDDLGILLEQKYGEEKDWKEHFEYFLPFLKDKRYIHNEDGKPVLMIHRPTDISCLKDMVDYWKVLAEENGIQPLYIIGSNIKYKIAGLDAILLNGPASYFEGCNNKKRNGITCYEYEEVWENAVRKKSINGITTFFGAFQDYDDTPRKESKGTALIHSSPEVFQKYLYQLAKKNMYMKNDFLFINAWNEWGEGMYLEPDVRNRYDYLEALSGVMTKINEEKDCLIEENFYDEKAEQIETLERQIDKFRAYYLLMDRWLYLTENGIDVYEYFQQRMYKKIAIYGFANIGKHLYTQLKDKDILIRYILDQDKEIKYDNLHISKPEEMEDDIDVVIITPFFYYNEICDVIRKRVSCPIVSIEEIIDDLIN